MSFSSLPKAATITGLLIKWRPNPRVGAFAGSGLSMGVAALSFALSAVAVQRSGYGTSMSELIVNQAAYLIGAAIVGAVAGMLAGQWESEPET
jgi:hypothetical protein